MTLDEVKDRCEEEGECLLWTGGMASGISPCLKVEGRTSNLRTLLWRGSGKVLLKDEYVGTTCKNPRCVLHLARKKKAKVLVGRTVPADTRRRIAMAWKAKSKLSDADVQAIRLSEATHTALSEQFGVAHSTIRKIRAGALRRDYSNPFAGLAA